VAVPADPECGRMARAGRRAVRPPGSGGASAGAAARAGMTHAVR